VPKSRQRHFSTLRTAFNIAYREWKVIAASPFEGLDGFRVRRKDKIEILTPEEVEKFLIELAPDWLPFFAISAFSGLRRQEVARLDWVEVKLDRSLIDLPPAKSKNNRRKLEEIPANLAAILAPYARPAGRVMPRKKIQRAMEDAAKKAGITWKQNVLRHSFCSYGVALRGLEWTADQADHDIRILRRNYREVVSREAAEAYFRIGSSPIPAIPT
jgi:integrase